MSIKNDQGFAPILVVVLIAVLASGAALSRIKVTTEIKNPPQVKVLGDSEENKQEETGKKQLDQVKEETKKATEQIKEGQKALKELEAKNTQEQLIKKNEIKKDKHKTETEVETVDGQRIKTKVEDEGRTKIEIEHGDIKLKYVVKDGKVTLKAENKEGEEVKLGDEDFAELENEVEDEVSISTESGRLAVSKNGIKAATNFPLSIDVGTNRLIVETPAGVKVVTVLPDQAVTNLLATGKVNVVESSASAGLQPLDGSIKLVMRDKHLVYEIPGKKDHQLLGFIPIKTDVTVFVSAETGEPIAQEQSMLNNIIDFLSPD